MIWTIKATEKSIDCNGVGSQEALPTSSYYDLNSQAGAFAPARSHTRQPFHAYGISAPAATSTSICSTEYFQDAASEFGDGFASARSYGSRQVM